MSYDRLLLSLQNLNLAIQKDPHLALAYFQRGTLRLQKERWVISGWEWEDPPTGWQCCEMETHISLLPHTLHGELSQAKAIYGVLTYNSLPYTPLKSL